MADGDDNGAVDELQTGEDADVPAAGAAGAAPARRPRRSPMDRDSWGRKLRSNGLTVAKRAQFLAVLSETSNVVVASRSVGAHKSAFYLLRDRDPAFAEAWARAVGHGHEDLATGMLARARGTAEPDDTTDPVLGMAVLKRLDAAAAGRTAANRVPVRQVPLRDVYAEILRRLALIAKRLEAVRPTGKGR